MILVVLALLLALAGVCVAGWVLLRRERERTQTELARTRAEAAELRARVEALALQASRPVPEPQEFVITSLGDGSDGISTGSTNGDSSTSDAAGPQRIDGRLFADIVLRESVVKAAALTHGVRRALAPEVRNRIRFEMKREVKRSRRARKDEYKRVRDEMRARERSGMKAPA